MRFCSKMSTLNKPLDAVGGFFLACRQGGHKLFSEI